MHCILPNYNIFFVVILDIRIKIMVRITYFLRERKKLRIKTKKISIEKQFFAIQ